MSDNIQFTRDIAPVAATYFRWSPEVGGASLPEQVMSGPAVVGWGNAANVVASTTVAANFTLVITNITINANPGTGAAGGTAGIFRLRTGTTVAGIEQWRGDYNPSGAFGGATAGVNLGSAQALYFGDNTIRIPAGSVFCATVTRFTSATPALLHIVGYLERFID